MTWEINFDDEFLAEFEEFSKVVQKVLLGNVKYLEIGGPELGRPRVDTLKDSEYPNMKEMRFKADKGAWRVAFAFDPKRNGIILVAGDKSNDKKFYEKLIKTADKRFKQHLAKLEAEEKGEENDQKYK
jgi:hypothetical protein